MALKYSTENERTFYTRLLILIALLTIIGQVVGFGVQQKLSNYKQEQTEIRIAKIEADADDLEGKIFEVAVSIGEMKRDIEWIVLTMKNDTIDKGG